MTLNVRRKIGTTCLPPILSISRWHLLKIGSILLALIAVNRLRLDLEELSHTGKVPHFSKFFYDIDLKPPHIDRISQAKHQCSIVILLWEEAEDESEHLRISPILQVTLKDKRNRKERQPRPKACRSLKLIDHSSLCQHDLSKDQKLHHHIIWNRLLIGIGEETGFLRNRIIRRSKCYDFGIDQKVAMFYCGTVVSCVYPSLYLALCAHAESSPPLRPGKLLLFLIEKK
ncbi:hypothetical protein ACJX0J_000660, partial (mitochondrion) [Zea mays]